MQTRRKRKAREGKWWPRETDISLCFAMNGLARPAIDLRGSTNERDVFRKLPTTQIKRTSSSHRVLLSLRPDPSEVIHKDILLRISFLAHFFCLFHVNRS
jgi:hypothetical protein